ncbi:MAG: hypothetical protein ISQ13_00980, partial [Candidatus Margulisbacteria bacterium]|nr:hypothetical protein [Candidatus Margulisiibacteriota bacterium]
TTTSAAGTTTTSAAGTTTTSAAGTTTTSAAGTTTTSAAVATTTSAAVATTTSAAVAPTTTTPAPTNKVTILSEKAIGDGGYYWVEISLPGEQNKQWVGVSSELSEAAAKRSNKTEAELALNYLNGLNQYNKLVMKNSGSDVPQGSVLIPGTNYVLLQQEDVPLATRTGPLLVSERRQTFDGTVIIQLKPNKPDMVEALENNSRINRNIFAIRTSEFVAGGLFFVPSFILACKSAEPKVQRMFGAFGGITLGVATSMLFGSVTDTDSEEKLQSLALELLEQSIIDQSDIPDRNKSSMYTAFVFLLIPIVAAFINNLHNQRKQTEAGERDTLLNAIQGSDLLSRDQRQRLSEHITSNFLSSGALLDRPPIKADTLSVAEDGMMALRNTTEDFKSLFDIKESSQESNHDWESSTIGCGDHIITVDENSKKDSYMKVTKDGSDKLDYESLPLKVKILMSFIAGGGVGLVNSAGDESLIAERGVGHVGLSGDESSHAFGGASRIRSEASSQSSGSQGAVGSDNSIIENVAPDPNRFPASMVSN